MTLYKTSFKQYLSLKKNILWIFSSLIIGVIYFIALRSLFPIPSYYSDSFTWLGAATTGQPVTIRPVGYSKLIILFKLFSTSDFALIAAQYFCNLLVNLLLFFTCTYFFCFRKSVKLLLFVLLVANPFYLFYSNYLSSDAFFNCLTVALFVMLIWIMYKPSPVLIVGQLIILAGLFELRYNAIFFPGISTLALLLSKMPVRKKITSIAGSFILIAAIVIFTTYVTKNYTGTTTFSAFSGWQLANDALHVMQHDKIDTTKIEDKEVKNFIGFTTHFFDTAKQTFPDSTASAVYMWHAASPLKTYMLAYHGRSKSYFKTWNALGPVYNNFGKAVILQQPVSYLRHFVFLNAKAYLFPPLEIYDTYMEDRDTIAAVAMKYYHYKTSKTPRPHPGVYSFVFLPMQYLFVAVNLIFILFGIYYVLSGQYKKQAVLYNHTLLCFTAFYMANFFFIVLLAPSVLRYHIFILTLSFPILLYLLQQLITPVKRKWEKPFMAGA